MTHTHDFVFVLPQYVSQIFALLSTVNIDFHPDAHAVRLKFSLATMASSMGCPWDPCKQLEAYVRKNRAVSAACRLTPEEELSLLEQYAQESRLPLLFNRLNFLRILVHAGPQASGAKVPLTTAPRPQFTCFDTYIDQTCTYVDLKGGGSSVFGFITAISYNRPEPISGQGVLDYLHVRMLHVFSLNDFIL